MSAIAFRDRYGMPLSTHSAEAVELYQDGVDRFRAFEPGAEAALRRALELDAGFAMAHSALAAVLTLQERMAEARAAWTRAEAFAAGATTWEQAHIGLRALTTAGGKDALEAQIAHLDEYPRDAAVLGMAAMTLAMGPHRDKREMGLAFFERLAPTYGDDWYFLSRLAWAYQEGDQLENARRAAEQSLAQRPRAGQAIHTLAHVFYESDDHSGGSAFLDDWLSGCDREMPLYTHFSWHLALAELGRGRYDRVREIYETRIHPEVTEGSGRRGLTDGASLLWRLHLYQCAWGALPWGDVCAAALRVTDRPGMAFNDVHAALAYAAAGDEAALRTLSDGLRDLDAKGHPTAGTTVLPLVEAIAAFGRGEYAESARGLETLMDRIILVGGSNAQREVFEDTLVEAYLRAGEYDRAETLLRKRLDRRSSARDYHWLGRAQAGHRQATSAMESLVTAESRWQGADATSPELARARQLRTSLESGAGPTSREGQSAT